VCSTLDECGVVIQALVRITPGIQAFGQERER